MRAVAVMLVLAYHCGVPWLGAGYLGVDVFFVISGYVITRLIIRERRNGTWRFRVFLRRRAERLLPALTVTIVVTLLIAPLVMSDVRYQSLLRSVVAAQLWIANVHYWLLIDYFENPARYDPLLHTWSLAVEEQFYLVWPVLLALVLKFASTRHSTITVVIVLALVSAVLAVITGERDADAAHYLPHLRAYQFLAGAALCWMPARTRTKGQVIGPLSILALIGLALLAPGGGNPALAGGLVATGLTFVALRSAETRSMERILGHAIAVWIGRRAYAIYLVHWPILVLWGLARDGDVPAHEVFFCALMSLACGHVLHVGVERRFQTRIRSPGSTGRRPQRVLAAIVAASVIFALGFGSHYAKAVAGNRLAFPDAFDLALEWPARAAEHRTDICNLSFEAPAYLFQSETCATPIGERPAWLVIGDSTAADNHAILNSAYPGVDFGQFTVPGCPTTLPDLLPQGLRGRQCLEKVRMIYKVAAAGHYQGIVLSLNEALWPTSHVVLVMDWAARNGLDVAVLTHKPRFRFPVPDIIMTSRTRAEMEERAKRARLDWTEYIEAPYVAALRGHVRILVMEEIACPESCAVLTPEGLPIYLDRHHLSRAGAIYFGDLIRDAHPNFLTSGD